MDFEEKLKSNISFCNKQSENIINDHFKKKILTQLYNNYQVSVSDRDLIILRHNFTNNLIKNKHYMTLQAFGNNYFLYLTRYNSNNVCFFIDTKIKEGFLYPRIIETKYRFSNHLFNGTLFKGELIKTYNNKWIYNIYDIISMNGVKIIKKNILNKYELISNILKNDYIKDNNLEVCGIMVRRIFEYDQIDQLEIFIKKLQYKTKGIIFNPKNYNYNNLLYIFPYEKKYVNNKKTKLTVKQESINFKPGIHLNNEHKYEIIPLSDKSLIEEKINIKNYKKNIVIFKISKTEIPDIFDLSVLSSDLKTYIKYSIAHVQTLKTSRLVSTIFKKDNTEHTFVECQYSLNFKKWEPLKLSEKKMGNTFNEIKILINQNFKCE